MNWQWFRTLATAASMAGPSLRRCAATSINGIGGGLVRKFIERPYESGPSTNDNTGTLALRRRHHGRTRRQATRCDFKTGHRFLARHGRRSPGTYSAKESEQFGAQRLGMADRQVPH